MIGDLFEEFLTMAQMCRDSKDVLNMYYWGNLFNWVSYAYIPMLLVYVAINRKKISRRLKSILIVFSTFVIFCGITHFIGWLVMDTGYHRLHSLFHLISGLVSVGSGIYFTVVSSYFIKGDGIKEVDLSFKRMETLEKRLKFYKESYEGLVSKEAFFSYNLMLINNSSLTTSILNEMAGLSFKELPVYYDKWNLYEIDGKKGRHIGVFNNPHHLFVLGEYEEGFFMDFHAHPNQIEAIIIITGSMTITLESGEESTYTDLMYFNSGVGVPHSAYFSKDTKLLIGWSPKKDEIIKAIPIRKK